ncbi:HAD family hydrolase [Paenibacillus ihumii]|uniref:HAD family hydrolase n=1 Tax=Paenibacillus ihumii TaxID=687436 RepID=UPI0006D78908|nr:HAD family hydrolase [Paenibacillus ihumii]
MNNIQAVIFDLDNTILDRKSTFNRFVISFVRRYFQHLEDTEHIMNRIIYLDQDGYKDKDELFSELLEELPWAMKPGITELLDYYRVNYVANASLMEYAYETITYARQKYKLGLITNGRNAIQYGKIDQLGIRHDFDLIIVSEEAGIKKPNVKIFEMAIEKFDLRPEQCLYIGDHPINDIEGAGRAGMETIWFEVNQPWREEVKISPKHTIKHLRELVGIL